MTETLDLIQKAEEEDNREYPVRDSWFKGYIEGNALIPQILNIFGFTTMAAVLRDPPHKWEEFFYSWFSDEQIKDQGRYMTMLHKAKGIDVVDQHHATADSKKVATEGRLHQFWLIAKNSTLFSLLDYIKSTKGEPLEDSYQTSKPELYQDYCDELNNFFNDPANGESVQKLRDVIEATREGFLTEGGKQLARIYRTKFDRTGKEDIKTDPKLSQIAIELQRLHPNDNISDAARREFSNQAREFALEKIPEFRGNEWYGNLRF